MHVDSQDFPASERFEVVRDGAGQTFDLTRPSSSDPVAAQDFAFRASWWRCDRVIIGTSSFDDYTLVRSARNLRADHVDHYRVLLQTRGTLSSDADGIRQVMGQGGLVITDMAQPAGHQYEQGANVVLFVPREVLDEALPRTVDLHGAAPRGAAANLLSSHLRVLADDASRLGIDEAPAVAQATINLLAACLAPSSDTLDRAGPAIRSTLLRQMCQYIDMHLGEPDLSADRVAAFFKISRPSLYRFFEPLEGVASYIRERRLSRAHSMLMNTPAKVVIGQLALDHGFRSAANFSRAFRARYGYAPQDLRQGACVVEPLAHKRQSSANIPEFDAWIRSLRD